MNKFKEIAERAVNSGWQYIVGATTGVSLFGADWKALVVGALVAAGSSVVKCGVAYYYTDTFSLVRPVVKDVQAVIENPAVKPVIDQALATIKTVPAVAKLEEVAGPVIAAVEAAPPT